MSAESVGSPGLWLGAVELPPGGRTRAHVHAGHESGFHLVSGDSMELWTGDQLEQRVVARADDDLQRSRRGPNVAVSRSQTVPAAFVGARTYPNVQDSVVTSILTRMESPTRRQEIVADRPTST